MLRKITKAIFALAAIVLAVGFVTVGALCIWVMTGPKPLTKLLPSIEASLNPPDAQYRVEIESAVLFWESWSQPLDVRLRGVRIGTREETRLLELSEISIGLEIAGFFPFKIMPESVVLREPHLRFYRDEIGDFFIGMGENPERYMPLATFFSGFSNANKDEENGFARHLRLIAIQHARLTLGKPGEKATFDAKDANLRIKRIGENVLVLLGVNLQENGHEAQLSGEVHLASQRKAMQGKLRFTHFSPSLLADIFPYRPEWRALVLPLSGRVDMDVDSGNVKLIDFALESEKGVFNYGEHFTEPFTIEKAQVSGQLRDNLRQIILKEANFDFGGPTLTAAGLAERLENGWTYEAQAVAENMPVNDLYKYWPKTLSPTSYHWVTTHIREGVVPRAEARVKLAASDLGKPFPESALDVNIQAQGVEVEYLPGHPKVKGVKGLVHFTGKGMEITSQQGAMLSGAILKDAWLLIPDLVAPVPEMLIRLQVDAPASDVASYVSIKELGYAQALGLNPETISGNASGKLEFDFLLPSKARGDDHNPHVNLLIEADLTNAAQPGFMGDMDLSDVSGKLNITTQELRYDGLMSVAGAPLQVALAHSFPTQEFQTHYTAEGALTVPQLKAFGVPELPFLSGSLVMRADILRGKGASRVKVDADLTQVEANIPQIGFAKPLDTQARLEFEAEKTPDALDVKSFSLTGAGITAKGSAKAKNGFGMLEKLNVQPLEFGENKLALTVDRNGEAYRIRANGASLDLRPLLEEKEPVEDVAPKKEFKLPFAIDLKTEFDRIAIAENREMKRVSAVFNCAPERCESAEVKGASDEKSPFRYEIKRVNGTRELTFTAENAGSFLKAMHIYDNMLGGTLNVHGSFKDAEEGNPFQGKLAVTEHVITNAPVLAKMASLLSLSGIGDALVGKGITFERMDGKIAYGKQVFTMKDGRVYGPALGITIENAVLNRATNAVSVAGTIVPSYTLNSVLNNIPLIGAALSGGKGEGVFAANYRIEGTYPDKTEVSVNPLTMLAPGFLRKMFDIGGGKEKAMEKAAAPAVSMKNKKEPAEADKE